MPSASRERLTGIRPLWAVEGGRIDLLGSEFPVQDAVPQVRIGPALARVVFASPSRLSALVPPGLEGGATSVRIDGLPGETAFLDVAAEFATGLHQVDNPAYDDDGNLYVTCSGSRGQQMPVSIFKVHPNGARASFVSGIVNATSLAFHPTGDLYVSSRFEGSIYRVHPDGKYELVASELGVACGLAFASDGSLFVGDRSGTVFQVDRSGSTKVFATLPASVAAFHLAMGLDGVLYVTAPTLDAYDHVYRIDSTGKVEIFYSGFGRPQGLAVDPQGVLYVVEALAGWSGLYRFSSDGTAELVLAGPSLVGVAFAPGGGLAVSSNEVAYRLDVSVPGGTPAPGRLRVM